LLAQFREASVLEANRDDPANAAQIDRRAREDSRLLAELLRAYGFYDAAVTNRVEAAAAAAILVLDGAAGPQYRFAEVASPDRCGADAGAHCASVRGRDRRAGRCPPVTAGGGARAELGRARLCLADVGTLDVAVDHATRTATLVLPVQPTAPPVRPLHRRGRPVRAEHIQTIARFDRASAHRRDRRSSRPLWSRPA
jgi:translocation and assembly module TamA